MFVSQILCTLGLPPDTLATGLLPADRATRLQEKAQRLRSWLQRRFAALVRHRRVIEGLHVRVSRAEKQGRRLDHLLAALERRERFYQERLAGLRRARHKLVRVKRALIAKRSTPTAVRCAIGSSRGQF